MDVLPPKSPSPCDSTNSKPSRLRIVDILQDRDGDEMDSSPGRKREDYSPPRRIIHRLFRWLKEKRCADQTARPEEARDETLQLSGGGSSSSVCNDFSSATEPYRKEATFNLGVACGLLYLAAANKNELSKMVEMRTQMEMLLQNIKDNLKIKERLLEPSEFSEFSDRLTSNTDRREGLETSSHLSLPTFVTSYYVGESETLVDCGSDLKRNIFKREESVDEMDQLEAELEAELDRLQQQLDSETLPKYPQQQMAEDTGASACSLSSGEVIDPQDRSTALHQGISRFELERKLHELLEERQQERIIELEAALDCAMHKLHEKELEVAWWKDTARLISRHASGASRPSL